MDDVDSEKGRDGEEDCWTTDGCYGSKSLEDRCTEPSSKGMVGPRRDESDEGAPTGVFRLRGILRPISLKDAF